MIKNIFSGSAFTPPNLSQSVTVHLNLDTN